MDTTLDHRATLPPFRFDCGLEDPLIDPNRELAAALQEAGIEFTYEEFSSSHE